MWTNTNTNTNREQGMDLSTTKGPQSIQNLILNEQCMAHAQLPWDVNGLKTRDLIIIINTCHLR